MRIFRLTSILWLTTACPGEGTPAAESTDPGSTGAGTDSFGTTRPGEPGATDDTGLPTEPGDDPTTAALGDTETTGADDSSSGGGDSSSSSGDGSSTGAATVCGDGIVAGDEQCDDGNDVANDGCSLACESGPGAELPPFAPELAQHEDLWAMAIVGKQQLGGDAHGLYLGSVIGDFGPEAQVGAKVQRVPLAGGPSSFAYAEHAGVYGRVVYEATTAANGDVIVIGAVYTEHVKVDTGGYLWMARFSPAGQVVWSVETKAITTIPGGMALTSDGDIVFAGNTAGYSTGRFAHRFRGSDGALVWTYTEPQSMTQGSSFGSLALDADDNVYISGSRGLFVDPPAPLWTVIRSLDADGVERWEYEHVADAPLSLLGGGILVTADEQLVTVALERPDIEQPTRLVFIGLDLDGAPLWSKPWTPNPEPQEIQLGGVAATADGGMYLTGWIAPYDDHKRFMARFDAEFEPVWLNQGGGEPGGEIELDPDGVPHVLTPSSVVAYAP